MTETATTDWFGRWGTSVFSENTAIFLKLKLSQIHTFKPRTVSNAIRAHACGVLMSLIKWPV